MFADGGERAESSEGGEQRTPERTAELAGKYLI